MVDVRFELTTNDPWSVEDPIFFFFFFPFVKAFSPLGYWLKVNQSPTQTNPYNTLPPAVDAMCEVTGRIHRVSPCRSAYFASPWPLLTLTSEDVGEKQLYYSQRRDGI